MIKKKGGKKPTQNYLFNYNYSEIYLFFHIYVFNCVKFNINNKFN